MNLSISFRNLDPSESIAAHASHRAVALATKLDPNCRLRVTCGIDAGWADVEVVGRMGARAVVARVEEADMYDAIDAAFEKITTQARRDHDRRVRRHRRRPELVQAAG